jgi:hypothetical protein
MLLAFIGLPFPAHAWDQKGHRVIAAIAWDIMDPDTRTKAAAILRGAPGDSGLLAEDSGSALPQAPRDRELFLRAATWPDIVRDRAYPVRRKKYHQSPSHYVNLYWQERNRKPVERKDLGTDGDLIARLAERATVLGDPSAPAGQRAVALAWFEHLVGDVHQPLHASARVTAFEPKGEHGGNDFCLGKTHPLGPHDCSANLHALWDDILVSQRPHGSVDAVAVDFQARTRKPFLIGLGNYEGWARESLKLAETKAYPPTLFRRVKPTPAYYSSVLAEAEPRLALAGYCLGEALNALLR